jgi:hypothetical protein
MILDGMKKRLYDENNKKGSKWISEISSVVWGLRTQPSNAIGQSPFFLMYGSELYYRLMSCGNLLDWRCTKRARLMMQDILSLIQQKNSDAMLCFSQLATYKASVITTTGTFKQELSTLVIWSFAASRTRPGCTSLIHDGRDPSSCSRLQDQGRIAYSTLMARRSQTP